MAKKEMRKKIEEDFENTLTEKVCELVQEKNKLTDRLDNEIKTSNNRIRIIQAQQEIIKHMCGMLDLVIDQLKEE